MTIDISVVVPIYNVEQFLYKCLDSCVNQTFKNIEVICVNDGSPDNSGKIIEEFAAKDKRVIHIKKQNEGLLLARKTGIEEARGKYIFFLDGDDYLPLNALELLYASGEQNQADIVKGKGLSVSSSGKVISEFSYPNFSKMSGMRFLHYMMKYQFHSVWGTLIKIDCFRNLAYPLGVSIGEDLVYMTQLALNANKVSYVNAPVYYYFVDNVDSITHKESDIQNKEVALKYYNLSVAIKDIIQRWGNKKDEVNKGVVLLKRKYLEYILFNVKNKEVISCHRKSLLKGYVLFFLFDFAVQRNVWSLSWKIYLYYLYSVVNFLK